MLLHPFPFGMFRIRSHLGLGHACVLAGYLAGSLKMRTSVCLWGVFGVRMGAMSLEDAWGWDRQDGDVVPSAGCFGVAVWWQEVWG